MNAGSDFTAEHAPSCAETLANLRKIRRWGGNAGLQLHQEPTSARCGADAGHLEIPQHLIATLGQDLHQDSTDFATELQSLSPDLSARGQFAIVTRIVAVFGTNAVTQRLKFFLRRTTKRHDHSKRKEKRDAE
jgi:hypothetical protein